MNRGQAQEFLALARLMVKQARLLKQDGLPNRARELVERAVAFDRLAWAMMRPVPVRVASDPVRRVG
ncbi:MAG: hypothetical protein MEP57_07070 [Microvirga sp.]|nr:hypothetical protein [Microvirga sp.]